MSGAELPQTLPATGTITDDGDYKQVFVRSSPSEGKWYKVKAYPLPEWDDLVGMRKLVRNFEWRLIKAAQHGFEFPHYADRSDEKENPRIERIRARIETLDRQSQGASDANGDKLLIDAELETTRGLLAMALYRRVISGILQFCDERIAGKATDHADMEKLSERINHDYMEASTLFKEVGRRQGGYPDKHGDDVLGEMIGEPLKALAAMLKHDPSKPDGGKHDTEQAMHHFYDNRYRKTANVLANIDAATAAARKLAPSSPLAAHLITEFSDAAKQRVQTMRSDADYDRTICDFKGCHSVFIKLTPQQLEPKGEGFAARVTDTADSEKTVSLLKEYASLVYDLANVRTSRNESTADFVRQAEALVASRKTVSPAGHG